MASAQAWAQVSAQVSVLPSAQEWATVLVQASVQASVQELARVSAQASVQGSAQGWATVSAQELAMPWELRSVPPSAPESGPCNISGRRPRCNKRFGSQCSRHTSCPCHT